MKPLKHLGLELDERLSFRKYLKDKLLLLIKEFGRWKNYRPRHSLVTLNIVFLRSHSGYADIIYDTPNNMDICNKIKSLQYNAALVFTEAIRGSSKEKLYQELGFEYLRSRRWLKNFVYSTGNQSYQTRNSDNFLRMFWRTEYFTNAYFLYKIKE